MLEFVSTWKLLYFSQGKRMSHTEGQAENMRYVKRRKIRHHIAELEGGQSTEWQKQCPAKAIKLDKVRVKVNEKEREGRWEDWTQWYVPYALQLPENTNNSQLFLANQCSLVQSSLAILARSPWTVPQECSYSLNLLFAQYSEPEMICILLAISRTSCTLMHFAHPPCRLF